MAKSIAHICSVSMGFTKKGGEPYWEWLYAVPLLHQLQLEDGVVHNDMSVDPYKINWGTQELESIKLLEFRGRMQKQRYVCKYIAMYICAVTFISYKC